MTHSQQQLGQVHDANPFMTRDAVAVFATSSIIGSVTSKPQSQMKIAPSM